MKSGRLFRRKGGRAIRLARLPPLLELSQGNGRWDGLCVGDSESRVIFSVRRAPSAFRLARLPGRWDRLWIFSSLAVVGRGLPLYPLFLYIDIDMRLRCAHFS
jgi:hypothetical protein